MDRIASTPRFRASLFIPLPLSLMIIVSGCGPNDKKLATVPVRGQVFVDGKPAGNAILVFHPIATAGLDVCASRATTDESGFYELRTYSSGDGAPLGEYKVSALWRGPLPANADSEDFSMSAYEEQPDRLEGRYEDPDASGLRMTIERSGDLPPLELTTK